MSLEQIIWIVFITHYNRISYHKNMHYRKACYLTDRPSPHPVGNCGPFEEQIFPFTLPNVLNNSFSLKKLEYIIYETVYFYRYFYISLKKKKKNIFKTSVTIILENHANVFRKHWLVCLSNYELACLLNIVHGSVS